jgi:serine/threonine protein kinase
MTAIMAHAFRGSFNPFTSSGRQFYFYRLLRFGLDRADQVDIKVPFQEKKQQGDSKPSKPRRKSLSYKGFSFKNLRNQFLGDSGEETENSGSRAATQRRTSKFEAIADQKHPREELTEFDAASEELALEAETIPLLTHHREIQGRRGRYRVSSFLGNRGRGRLYRATQATERESTVLREYLLPSHTFSPREVKQRKQEFERLTGLNLFDGKARDFRIIGVFEAVADEQENRCYLVTKGSINSGKTLRDYLQENGPLPDWQVHKIIRQVLQSLEFLHSHKFRLANDLVQRGLIHNNLSLDSLLYIPHETNDDTGAQDFFIYLTDLGVWENLFIPSTSNQFTSSIPNYKPKADLYDLGKLSFYLLVGREFEPETGFSLDPRNKMIWPATNAELKDFILRLLGLNGSFETATAAWLALPIEPPKPLLVTTAPPQEKATPKPSKLKQRILWFLGGLLTVLLLGVLGWLIYVFVISKMLPPTAEDKARASATVCCMHDTTPLDGRFSYASQKDDVWNFILKNPNLIAFNKTLEQVVAEKVIGFQLTYKPEVSLETAIQKLRSRELDFIVSALPRNTNELGALKAEFQTETLAYDGLAIFVPFSDFNRPNNLPRSLNGQISFAQLRQLYTGKIKNWRELGGPNIPVKLYMPTDTRLVQLFEQRVFANHPEELALFRKLQRETIEQTESTQTLRNIFGDFENDDIGSIGFDSFSKVFNQCTVYPLAVANENTPAIQAVTISTNNHQPLDPKFDLCDNRGSYWLSPSVFRGNTIYPLMNEIAVIFPQDSRAELAGKKFAAMFKTQEGQKLLKEANLVPLMLRPLNSPQPR